MEDCTDNKRKRVRDDSFNLDANSHNPKRLRFHLDDSTLLRVDSDDSRLNSPEAKRIQEDLLHILDEDTATERGPEIQGLESLIRSLEEEILVPPPAPAALDQTSDSGESQRELGYLLEASDDELGLPPTISFGAEAKIEAVNFETSSSDAVGIPWSLGFENEMLSYDSFKFGLDLDTFSNVNDNSGDLMALGGLFDFSDRSFEPADNSEFSSWPESLHAL